MGQINPRFGFRVKLMTRKQLMSMVEKREDLLIFMNQYYGVYFSYEWMGQNFFSSPIICQSNTIDLSSDEGSDPYSGNFFLMTRIKILPFLNFESNSSSVATYSRKSYASDYVPKIMDVSSGLTIYSNYVCLQFNSIDEFVYLVVPLQCIDKEDTFENEKALFQTLPSFSVRAIAFPSYKTLGAKMNILENYCRVNGSLGALIIPPDHNPPSSSASGLVLYSSTGDSYLLSIDDSGNLQTTQVFT